MWDPSTMVREIWFLLIAGNYSVVFSSVAQLCPTLGNPMDCSMPGFPVHHQFPELAQTHVHRVGDAIQPSHLLSSPFPLILNLSQHQGLFQWVSSSHQVAQVLEFQLYSPWYIVTTQKTLEVSSLGISPCLWKVTFNLCWVICFSFLVLRKSAI